MKKLSTIIVLLGLLSIGAWYMTKKPRNLVNTDLKTYRNSNMGISFIYPKILTASTTKDLVTLHHEVGPFPHHDFCDFKGDSNTIIQTLTDFQVDFHVSDKNIVDTMKSESPYIPQESFVNNTVIVSPGFIDEYTAGDKRGYKIFEGAEGCGHTTYYLSISSKKTIVVREDLITVFTGSIDASSQKAAEAIPNVINKQKETEILTSVLQSLSVQ
ncbi:hypothetical protein H0W91_02505 [Patescibacteria group bacterium]|nr:hypothetical protein [Patescibacteria group bacterium]